MSPRFRLGAALALLAVLCMPAAYAAGPEKGASGRAAPDLTVVPGSYATNPDPPRLWDSIIINVTVINQGDASAGLFQVAFYLNNTTKSIGTATVNSLPAGNTTNVSVNWATSTTETFEYFQGVNYKIVVKVDYNSRVAESDENNNLFEKEQALGPPRLPDLSLLDFTVSPAGPVKGQLVTVNVTFTNTGEAPAKFFRVYIYQDSIQQLISYKDVSIVNVSEVRTVSLGWDTSACSIGTHLLLVHVNPDFLFTSIDEMDATNNNGSRAVVVAAPDFKLVLAGLELSPAELHVGDTLNVNWTLRNDGTQAAENFTVRITLDGAEFFPGETVSLDPGRTYSSSAENETALLAVGNHTLRFLAGNIDAERQFVLHPMRLADLLLKNVSWDPLNPRVDQSVLMTMDAVNAGGLASNACTLALYVDYSTRPQVQKDVPALAPGAYASFRFLWDTTGLPASSHHLRLHIDSGMVVAEINETNNNFRWDIVLSGEMDLAIENLTIRPRPPRAGDGVQFAMQVRNLGSLTSPASNLTLRINGLQVDRRAIGALDRGRVADVTLAWATAGLPPGNYTYELALDPIPGDVDPQNNINTDVLGLLAPPPAPDLRVSRIELEPGTPRSGENLSLGILIENVGTLDSGQSSIMIYLDSGLALLKFTDSPVAVPAIPVGSSALVNVSRDTRSFKPATYMLNVTVDYKNEIAELNETNNRFTMELVLAEPVVRSPVLAVGEVALSGGLRQGSDVQLTALIANLGEGDARSVTVSFIVDGNAVGTVQLDLIKAGANQTAKYTWKATAGKHSVSAKAETQGADPAAGPSRQITVEGAKAPTGGADLTVPILAGVVVAAAAAGGAGLLLWRRKRGPAPP